MNGDFISLGLLATLIDRYSVWTPEPTDSQAGLGATGTEQPQDTSQASETDK